MEFARAYAWRALRFRHDEKNKRQPRLISGSFAQATKLTDTTGKTPAEATAGTIAGGAGVRV